MKKKLLIAFLMLFALVFASAACTQDDSKKAALHLSAGEGGSLEKTEYEVEVGMSLAQFLKEIAPSAEEGLTFAGWYSNGELISDGATMPEEGISLTAEYYAQYTVEIYLQAADGTYGEAERESGQALYRKPFTAEVAEEHYAPDEEREGRTSTDALQKNEVFTVYLAREVYRVSYMPNLPQSEVSGRIDAQYIRYGGSVTLADGSMYEVAPNLRFAGWSRDSRGGVEYRAGESFAPQAGVTMYAVWDTGYHDRFGSYDFLFFPQTDDGVAVLRRAGQEFFGVRDGDAFTFPDVESAILRGRVHENGTFAFFREAQANRTYRHYDAYTHELAADGATMQFDGYDGAVYTSDGESHTGTYSYDEETGLYAFRYAESSAGFEFLVEEVGGEEVFFIRGAEAAQIYYEFRLTDNNSSMQYGDAYFLDGFGGLVVFDFEALLNGVQSVIMAGEYTVLGENEIAVNAYDEDSTYAFRCRLTEYAGENGVTHGWFRYYEQARGVFTGDGTLTLDGYGNEQESAVYRPASGRAQYGLFTVEEGRLGTIVRFTSQGITTCFRLNGTTFEEVGGKDYTEALLYTEEGKTALPLLVLDGRGGAQLWLSTTVHAANGTVTLSDGRYHYKETERLEAGEFFSEAEFSLKQGTFTVNGKETELPVYVLYDAATVVRCTEKEGTAVLEYDRYGFATLKEGSLTYEGKYAIFPFEDVLEYTVFEFYYIEESNGYYVPVHLYFALEGTTFARLGDEAGAYSFVQTDYTIPDEDDAVMTPVLYLTGRQDALYFDSKGVRHIGTYARTGEYFTFTAQDINFLFDTGVDEDGDPCFVPHTSRWEGSVILRERTQTGENVSPARTLTFDGYCSVKPSDGDPATYFLVEDLPNGLLRVYITDGATDAYYDLDLEKLVCVECGYEIGEYTVYERGLPTAHLLSLDGYGAAKLFDTSSGTAKTVKSGSYVQEDIEQGILIVTFDGEEPTHVRLQAVSDGSDVSLRCTFEVTYAGVYRSDGYEILEVDQFGDAVYYDRYGIPDVGVYDLIGEGVGRFTGDSERFFTVAGGTIKEHTEGYLYAGNTLYKYLGGRGDALRIPDGVTVLSPLAFSRRIAGSNYEGAHVVTIDLNEVTEVGDYCFDGCSALTSVKGLQVQTLGDFAFYACLDAVKFDLPALKTVGVYAFWRCESLETASFSALEHVSAGAFGMCYALESVSLPAARTVEDGAFYDCFALRRVVLGEQLTRLGNAEYATGVFERTMYEAAQNDLTVVLGGDLPEIGHNLFFGVERYRIAVSLDALLKAYGSEDWAPYAQNMGVETGREGTYARVSSSLFAVLSLDIVATYGEKWQAQETLGAYTVSEDGVLTFYQYAPTEKNGYRTFERGVFTKDGLEFDFAGDGAQYPFYGPDREYVLEEMEDSGESLTFTLRGEDEFSLPAVFENGAGAHDVTLVCTRTDGALRLYFDLDGTRYTLSLYGNPAGYFDYETSDVPVISSYFAADGSQLTLSKEGDTTYVSALLAGVSGVREFRFERLIPTWLGDTRFTVQTSFEDTEYTFTFDFSGDAFSYTYVATGQMTLLSADEQYRLLLTLNGEIVHMVLAYLDEGYGEPAFVDLDKSFYRLVGDVYHYYVYDNANYGQYYIAIAYDESGVPLSFTVQEGGETVRAFMQGGNYAYVYLDGKGAFEEVALHFLSDHGYVYVPYRDCSEADGILTIVVEGEYANTYWVDCAEKTLVREKATFEADTEYGELVGSAAITWDRGGAVVGAELTVNGEKITAFTASSKEDYYIFRGQEGVYHVRITPHDLRIFALTEQSVSAGGATLSILVDKNYELVYAEGATFLAIGDPGDHVYAIETGEKAYLLETGRVSTLTEMTKKVLTAEGGAYRVTVLFDGAGNAVAVTSVEDRNGSGYTARTITSVMRDGSTFYIDVVPSGSYELESYTITVGANGVTVSKLAV